MAQDPFILNMPLYQGVQQSSNTGSVLNGQLIESTGKLLAQANASAQKQSADGLVAALKNAGAMGQALVDRYTYLQGQKQTALITDFQNSEDALMKQRLHQKDGTDGAYFNADGSPRNAAIDSALRTHYNRIRQLARGGIGIDDVQADEIARKSTEQFSKRLFGHLAGAITARGRAAFDNSFYSAIDRGAYNEGIQRAEEAHQAGIINAAELKQRIGTVKKSSARAVTATPRGASPYLFSLKGTDLTAATQQEEQGGKEEPGSLDPVELMNVNLTPAE